MRTCGHVQCTEFVLYPGTNLKIPVEIQFQVNPSLTYANLFSMDRALLQQCMH